MSRYSFTNELDVRLTSLLFLSTVCSDGVVRTCSEVKFKPYLSTPVFRVFREDQIGSVRLLSADLATGVKQIPFCLAVVILVSCQERSELRDGGASSSLIGFFVKLVREARETSREHRRRRQRWWRVRRKCCNTTRSKTDSVLEAVATICFAATSSAFAFFFLFLSLSPFLEPVSNDGVLDLEAAKTFLLSLDRQRSPFRISLAAWCPSLLFASPRLACRNKVQICFSTTLSPRFSRRALGCAIRASSCSLLRYLAARPIVSSSVGAGSLLLSSSSLGYLPCSKLGPHSVQLRSAVYLLGSKIVPYRSCKGCRSWCWLQCVPC